MRRIKLSIEEIGQLRSSNVVVVSFYNIYDISNQIKLKEFFGYVINDVDKNGDVTIALEGDISKKIFIFTFSKSDLECGRVEISHLTSPEEGRSKKFHGGYAS